MQQETINRIFEILSQNNSTPKTELKYTNNFTFLVAVILSAQSTDIGVNKATKELFIKYDTPEKFLTLGMENLKKHIKTIGLYNNKAQNIMNLCNVLIEHYNSQVPDNFEDLTKLPGVGRKTANVILNNIFGKQAIAVDTHVFRVSKRIGLATSNTPEKVENELLQTIPDKWLDYASNWLVLHGRYICKAKKPMCNECPINTYCEYYNVSLTK